MREIFLLEDEELAQIHRASLRILEKTGMVVAHQGALQLLQEHGARVDWEQQLAWFSEELVSQALASVPAAFILAGGNPEHDVPLGKNGRIHARAAVGADFVVDPGAARHRPATLRDTENWIRLINQLPNVHVVGCPYPGDGPAVGRDLLVVERVLELSRKPLLISHYSSAALRWSLELAAMLPRRDSSRLMVFVSCNSPFTYSQSQTDILLTAARHRVPIAINTAPLAGATAPYSRAGLLAQMNAELLAGVALAQLAQPGAPVIWSPLPLVLDMRTMGAASGYAENGLLMAAFVQLGKFYRIPTHCLGLTTDAVAPDAQASQEKILGAYPAMLARPSLVGGAGGLSSYEVVSMEQLVLDSDALGGLFHALEGIPLDNDALAYDAIQRVGPGGHFLEDDHTMRYLRREYYRSHIANRMAPETWASDGGLELRDRAAGRVRKLLAAPVEPAVPEDLAQEMRRVVKRAQEELAATTN